MKRRNVKNLVFLVRENISKNIAVFVTYFLCVFYFFTKIPDIIIRIDPAMVKALCDLIWEHHMLPILS